jgi:hypothetical protein
MPVADPGGDSGLTWSRTELKYVVPRSQAGALKARLDGGLRRHHHGSATSALASMARHYTTTVYFDTPGRQLYREAMASAQHVKLRAREYYDVLPLAEHAVDASELVRHAPILWLELKRRAGDHSGKARVGVPKRKVPEFLATKVADEELRAIQRNANGAVGEAMLEQLLAFFDRFAEPLGVSCAVNYRRVAWQDDTGRLRVTLDEELGAFAPAETLWQREAPLTRQALGQPVRVEPQVVVEIKHEGALPAWLEPALDEAQGARHHYSKFVTASEAVHDAR